MHVSGDQPTRAYTWDRGGRGSETGGAEEVSIDRGSTVTFVGRQGQESYSGIAVRTMVGRSPVTGFEDARDAFRGTEQAICVRLAVGVALIGELRDGGTGADKLNGDFLGVFEAACFCAVVLGCGEGEEAKKICVTLCASPAAFKRVRLRR